MNTERLDGNSYKVKNPYNFIGNCIAFKTKKDALIWLRGCDKVLREFEPQKFCEVGRYDLRHNEYERPVYTVERRKGISLIRVQSYFYSPFNITEKIYLSSDCAEGIMESQQLRASED